MRIVVKVGSNVLTRPDGKPNVTNMSALIDQMASLIEMGHQVILVSSGAVACGRGALRTSRQLDAVEQRQLFSSIGQIRLINLYNQLFGQYGITVGQVLTQRRISHRVLSISTSAPVWKQCFQTACSRL